VTILLRDLRVDVGQTAMASANMRHIFARARWLRTVAPFLGALALAGCESGSSLVSGGQGAQPEAQLVQPAPVQMSRVSVAPVIGAPDSVSKQIHTDFVAAIGQKKITVVGAQDKSDYAVRGYVVAAKDKAGTKVSYIWDVTDQSGRRVNRITGEEVVAGAGGGDAWSVVTPTVTKSIAQKSSDSLSSWFAQNAQSAVAGPAPTTVTAATAVGALPATPAPTAQALVAPTPKPAAQPVAAAIPTLVGAPGDGNNALATALQAELSKNGLPAAGPNTATYRVEGAVKMGPAADGKQPVQIDWNVKDPQGKRLGTVTQKNEIAAGSLDGAWGKTADAAASAAAQGILKLLPKTGASN
jgi:hypothetical protein